MTLLQLLHFAARYAIRIAEVGSISGTLAVIGAGIWVITDQHRQACRSKADAERCMKSERQRAAQIGRHELTY